LLCFADANADADAGTAATATIDPQETAALETIENEVRGHYSASEASKPKRFVSLEVYKVYLGKPKTAKGRGSSDREVLVKRYESADLPRPPVTTHSFVRVKAHEEDRHPNPAFLDKVV